jgi:hypothetical protein
MTVMDDFAAEPLRLPGVLGHLTPRPTPPVGLFQETSLPRP